MKIKEVEALHLRLHEVREVAEGTQDVVVVRVTTDDGLTGLGEVVSCSHVARAVIEAPRSAPFRHGLAASVIGLEADDLEGVWAAMLTDTGWYGPGGVARHAMSGIDMALWDVRGKAAGVPVRRLLNPAAADSVPCYASVLWPDCPASVAASAASFLQEGYRAVKYGWGPMGRDATLDEELVAAARDALQPEVLLMVDAGRAWDCATAVERAVRFARHDVYWLEEPLDPYDFAGFAELAESSPVPIASGEMLTADSEFARLVNDGRVPVVQPDLGRVGGITQALRIQDLAERSAARAVPHAFGTGILLAASAQWMAAAPEPLTEFSRSHSPLARELVRDSMTFGADGLLHLSDAPGLGVELDEDVVRRFRVV